MINPLKASVSENRQAVRALTWKSLERIEGNFGPYKVASINNDNSL